MSGFFYLGGGSGSGGGRSGSAAANSRKEEDRDKQESNYLYNNRAQEEIYSNRGFEIWPAQYYQQEEHNNYATTSFSLGRNFLNFSSDESSSRSAGAFTIMKQGGMNCQDCGNQAKKDCVHLRCRTCCKSRGFQCQTHVKSTWVPAAKRRERQQQMSALHQQRESSSTPKRQRDQHQAALASSHLPVTTISSGLEMARSLPPEVSSPAVFRCVRVSSVDDENEEYAYQTAVNIGGHVFKGILYDQGPDQNRSSGGGESTSQQLNLVTVASTSGAMAPGVSVVEGSSIYPAPINAFIAGTQFFPPPRS